MFATSQAARNATLKIYNYISIFCEHWGVQGDSSDDIIIKMLTVIIYFFSFLLAGRFSHMKKCGFTLKLLGVNLVYL